MTLAKGRDGSALWNRAALRLQRVREDAESTAPNEFENGRNVKWRRK